MEEVGADVDNEDALSYEKFAGMHVSQGIEVLERLRRKQRIVDLESSSAESLCQLNDSLVNDNDACEETDDEEDELGALLGF